MKLNVFQSIAIVIAVEFVFGFSVFSNIKAPLRGFVVLSCLAFGPSIAKRTNILAAGHTNSDKPEDLDTNSEDHAGDSTRYACMSRPFVRQAEPKPTDKILGIGTHNQVTWDELIENQPTASRGSGRI